MTTEQPRIPSVYKCTACGTESESLYGVGPIPPGTKWECISRCCRAVAVARFWAARVPATVYHKPGFCIYGGFHRNLSNEDIASAGLRPCGTCKPSLWRRIAAQL